MLQFAVYINTEPDKSVFLVLFQLNKWHSRYIIWTSSEGKLRDTFNSTQKLNNLQITSLYIKLASPNMPSAGKHRKVLLAKNPIFC